MDSETTYAAIKASIDGSLVQLGRGSGITDEHRARMVAIIAHPLTFMVEEAVDEARGESQSRLEALEAEVQAKESALKSIIDTFHSDSRPMGHVAKAMLAIAAEALTAQPPARLRELVPPRDGAPTEEDSRG